MSPTSAPARLLTTTELQALVCELAANPAVWQDRIEPRPEERQYVRVLASEHVEVWIVAWMDGHDTGFHDHDDASAAITVLQGEVVDERLALGGTPIARRHTAGATFTVEAAGIHRVHHDGGPAALTLHAYSPPLERMGTYEVSDEGELLRHSRSGGERLEAAAA